MTVSRSLFAVQLFSRTFLAASWEVLPSTLPYNDFFKEKRGIKVTEEFSFKLSFNFSFKVLYSKTFQHTGKNYYHARKIIVIAFVIVPLFLHKKKTSWNFITLQKFDNVSCFVFLSCN